MIKWLLRNQRRFRSDDSGMSFVLVTMALPAIFGFAAISIDLGYAYYVKSKLQAAVDLGALAGGTLLYKDTESAVEARALQYVNLNLPSNWDGATPSSIRITSTAETKCLNMLVADGLTCDGVTKSNNGANGANALKVSITATAPLIFASALGFRYADFTANAVVAGSGASPPPLNIAIVTDSSQSMFSSSISTCGNLRNVTKIRCALFSMQGMLATLWPSIDKVALFTMPGLSTSLDSNTCSASPSRRDYRAASNAVYKVINFSGDYRLGGTPPLTGLNPASALVKAIGYQPNTPGATSNVAPCLETRITGSGVGSYFASSISSAQAALEAVNTALVANGESPRQNVMLILSDADANATLVDAAKANNQCAQSVTAAAAAKTAGTWVYAVSYLADDTKSNGVPTGASCSTDKTTTTTVTVTTTTTVTTKKYSCSNSKNFSCGSATVGTPVVTTTRLVQAPPAPANSSNTTKSVNPTPTCNTRNCSTANWTETTVAVTSSSPANTTTYNMTACDSLKAMASDPSKFFSVAGTNCTSPANQSTTDLASIFKNVAVSLMKKRRIPTSIN